MTIMTGELLNVLIDLVRIDGGTQPRVALNEDAVAEYAEALRSGAMLPPVTVYFDGSEWWLADGFHRYHAHRSAGASEIPAEVREGTRRDAILYSVGANAAHGLRRTNEDKRRAVMTLLNDADWSKWSDNAIAKACGVSQPFVSGLRQPSYNGLKMAQTRVVERNGKSYEQNTANIGKARADVASVVNAVGPASDERAEDASAVATGQEDSNREAFDQAADAISHLEGQVADLAAQLELQRAAAAPDAAKTIEDLRTQLAVVESQRNEWQAKCNELTREVKRLQRLLEKKNG